jgi:hypothetical protein
MKRITPVLVVPALEAVLPLWEALGFARVAEVPHGDALGFAILARGEVQLMPIRLPHHAARGPRFPASGSEAGFDALRRAA